MSVFTVDTQSSEKFNVYDVYAQKEQFVNSIAQEAIRAMTQTYIDMILEEQLDNRPAILEKLQEVRVSAVEYLDCVMNDLHRMVRNRMEKTSVEFSVRAIEYDGDELCNVDVVIKTQETS